ncbi:MAG: HAD family hydrolase [Candidatus Puniceispirillaceae bacterium]
MIRSLVFDKDGVILDMAGTWLPVARQVADYTLSRQPAGNDGALTRSALLAAVGVDDASGMIDPLGMFAREPFVNVRTAWQAMLPPDMINLNDDKEYRAEVKRLAQQMTQGNVVAKGDVETPLRQLAAAGFRIAMLTNDSEGSARRNMAELGIEELFDPIIGVDSGHGSKPDPDGLLHILSRHGSGPDEALMIGDTAADHGAAVNAGVADFICIADDPAHRPDDAIDRRNVITALSELPDLLVRRGDMKAG